MKNITMQNIDFETITDAYQLVKGAKIKGKQQEEIFELGKYDPNKRGYTVYPYEEGMMFKDFSVLVSEKELKNNYLIEVVKNKAIDAGAVKAADVFADINNLKSA